MTRFGTENKKTLHATVSPSTANLHWSAGFLEGEGCFTICGTKGARTAHVTATQVQKEPLERLLKFFGGSVLSHKGKRGPNTQQAYRWQVSGARARGVALTLYPLMSPRRQARIEEVMAV